MLYVHSHSPIERKIAQQLAHIEAITEIDIFNLSVLGQYEPTFETASDSILLYSFQRLSHFKYIHSFINECNAVDELIEMAKTKGIQKIILLTYPGAYFNSSNLFLQHRGIIEQKFHSSGIACLMLNVQAILDEMSGESSYHQLFFDESEGQYIIPKKSNQLVYSIDLSILIDVIESGIFLDISGKYDVFNQVHSLSSFLQLNAKTVTRMAPLYLYFKSYIGHYLTPTMMELFLLPVIPMYAFRTEKHFELNLFDALQSDEVRVQENVFYEIKLAHQQHHVTYHSIPSFH